MGKSVNGTNIGYELTVYEKKEDLNDRSDNNTFLYFEDENELLRTVSTMLRQGKAIEINTIVLG